MKEEPPIKTAAAAKAWLDTERARAEAEERKTLARLTASEGKGA